MLITLPSTPFLFKFYDGNEFWRDQLIDTITYLMNLKDYKIIYFTNAKSELIYLLRKIN